MGFKRIFKREEDRASPGIGGRGMPTRAHSRLALAATPGL